MIVTYLILICLVGGETIRRAIFKSKQLGAWIAMYSFIWLSWFAMARHCRYGTNLGFTKIRNSLLRLPEEYWKSSMQFYGWP